MKNLLLRILNISLVFLLLVCTVSSVYATSDIKISINGVITENINAKLINSRVYVPLRLVSETMGHTVDWDAENKIAIIYDGGKIKIPIGSNTAILEDGNILETDTNSYISNDNAMVGLRFISDILGYKVDWDGKTRTVFINNDELLSKPSIEIYTPNNQTVIKNRFRINGKVSDKIALVEINYTLKNSQYPDGKEFPALGVSPSEGLKEYEFEFDVILSQGNNEITVKIRNQYNQMAEETIHVFVEEEYIKPVDPNNVAKDPFTKQEFINNEMTITAKRGYTFDDIDEFVKLFNWKIVGVIPSLRIYQLELDREYSLLELEDLADELYQYPQVAGAIYTLLEEAEPFQSFPYNDPWNTNSLIVETWDESNPNGNNWGLDAIKYQSAMKYRDDA